MNGKPTEYCFECKKRTLITTQCKCSNYYCLKHIQSEKHTCSYDFKKDRIKLDLIVAQKVVKI